MAGEFEGLGDEIVAMREDRKRLVSTLVEDNKNFLKDCKKEDAERKAEMQNLMAETDKMVSDIHQETAGLKAEVGNMVSVFKQEDAARKAEVGNMISGFKQEDAARKAEMQSLVAEAQQLVSDIHKENAERHASWQEALRTISGGKAAPAPVVEEPAPAKPKKSRGKKKAVRKRSK